MPDSFRPVSPAYAANRSQSYYFQLALYAGGNVLAVAICLLLWFCWDVLSAFQEPLVWSYLCSLSLRDIKRYLVNTARRELQTSSFVVCCVKLVFLPAVIVWQLFEELRDKLQSKYHELQQKKQATPAATASGAATAAAADSSCSSTDAAQLTSNPGASFEDGKGSSDSDSEPLEKLRASPVAETRQATGLLSNSQAADDVPQQQHGHSKQQGLRQRKPPLVPKAKSAQTAGSGRKQSGSAGIHSAKGGKAAAAAAAAASTALSKPLAGKGAAAAAAKPAPHSRSKVQRRLRRYKHIAVRQLKWYWFCLVELLKFILAGLWPQQQKPQQQQQQQQLLLAPAVSSRVGRLSSAASYSSPVAAAASGRLTAAGGFEPFASTPMRVSAAGSISSSCMSEHGAWTPQQQQHRRLSTSYSSPSLVLGAIPSQGSLRHQLQLHNTINAASAGFHSNSQNQHQQQLLQHHVSVDDSMLLSTSFRGWATEQQQQQQLLLVSPVPFRQSPLQQQQQCQLPSRVSSNGAPSSNGSTGSIAAAAMSSLPASPAAAAAAVPAAAVVGGAAQGSIDPMSSAASGAVTPIRALAPDASAAAPPGHAYSAAAPVTAYAGEIDGTPAAAARFASAASSMSFGAGGSSFASPWEGFAAAGHEGLGLTSAVPTAPSSVITGLGSSGSPSNILFKWLLRGIVLFEGWRYAQSFWDSDQPLFVLLLLVGGTMAVAFGLPVLLLPSSLLWRIPLHDTAEQVEQCKAGDAADVDGASSSSGNKAGSAGILSPFQQQQQQQQRRQQIQFGNAAAGKMRDESSSSSWPGHLLVQAVWSSVVDLLVRADLTLRTFCSSSFLDTAVSGLIVVGLILGSVVLSVVLLVQVGDESRQAVLHMNTLVRQKVDSEGALRQGVRSLLQEYEGQVTTMLRDSLPSVTQYVESRAVEFLVSHNLSRVLLDLETVKAALHLPGDCSEEAKIQLAVQLANSSLAVQDLGQRRQQLQQQLDAEQQVIRTLAAQYEALQVTSDTTAQDNTSQYNGKAGSPTDCQGPNSVPADAAAEPAAAAAGSAGDSSSRRSSQVAHALLESQQRLAAVRESLHGVEASYDAASEQLQLAQLRLHNCHPEATTAAAGHARGFSSFLTSFWPTAGPTTSASLQTVNRSSGFTGPGAQLGHISPSVSHVRKMLGALTKFDFWAASNEAAAALGHLFPHQQEQGGQQQQGGCSAVQNSTEQDGRVGHSSDRQQGLAFPPVSGGADVQHAECRNGRDCLVGSQQQEQPLQYVYSWSGSSSINGSSSGDQSCSNRSSRTGTTAPAAATPSGSSSTGAAATGSIMRVAQGAAYPLISSMRRLSSVFFTGIGSTTAVALGTGLGVLRLGLGVMKFCVQLGVFASVLYTLLALDIDPVEQLVRLLPMSEASQDRASRAVTKAMRGVFVSSLKLAAFHAGFTWLTLRAFNTHFVCLATAASAVVAVLPLVPVALVALPAVLELALLRAAPVKGFVLAALHLGAYYFGDDLIFREVEPTLPYLVGLGVFGGMYTFKNPLQGVLLGPMVLALLSVGYNLHRALY